MKIVLTGATGFIGKNLLTHFHKKDDTEILALIRETSDRTFIEELGINYAVVNLLEPETVRPYIKDCDVFIHNAGLVRACNWDAFIKNNILPTQHLVDLFNSTENRLKRFIYMSSQAAAGPSNGVFLTEKDEPHPLNWYGQSKWLAEQYIKQNALFPYTIIRPTSVFGPFDTDFLRYFKLIDSGFFLYVEPFRKPLSAIYVEDLIVLIERVIEKDIAIKETYFAAGYTTSMYELGGIIKKIVGKYVLSLKLPVWLLYGLSYINLTSCIFSKKPSPIYPEKIKELSFNWVVSSEKAENELGFKPLYSLEQALLRTYNWYVENAWL